MIYKHIIQLLMILILVSCSNTNQNIPENIVELGQNYEGVMVNGDQIIMSYPTNWGVDGTFPDAGVVFGSPAELASLEDSVVNGDAASFASGNIRVTLYFMKKATVLAEYGNNATALNVLEGHYHYLRTDEQAIHVLKATTIEGLDAAVLNVSLSETVGEIYLVIIDAGDAYAILRSTFASGALPDYQATIEAMAASANYTLVATETSD